MEQLRSPTAIDAARPGEELKATLRPYQEQGVNWLWLLSQLGLGACLADDMGLGKTIQVIALLLLIKRNQPDGGDSKPSLLVLPITIGKRGQIYFLGELFLAMSALSVGGLGSCQ